MRENNRLEKARGQPNFFLLFQMNLEIKSGVCGRRSYLMLNR